MPRNVAELAVAGRRMQAIKLLARHERIGLTQAKRRIDRYLADQTAHDLRDDDGRVQVRMHEPLPEDVVVAALAGQKLEAIRLLVTGRGMTLRQAKHAVDTYLRDQASAVVEGDSGGMRRLAGAAIVIALVLLIYWWFG